MPVGGSRHYQGGGLGQVGVWNCPSCGESNDGALDAGCVHCGAGSARASRPETRTAAAPPPPEDPTMKTTLQLAYQAGYKEGYAAGVRDEQRRQLQGGQGLGGQQAQPPQVAIDPRTYRTIVAALSLFRDQVLAGEPEEVASGEWLSAADAGRVIDQLQQLLAHASEVPAHA